MQTDSFDCFKSGLEWIIYNWSSVTKTFANLPVNIKEIPSEEGLGIAKSPEAPS